MSPEKQRIAIARACGWRIVQTTQYAWVVICPSKSKWAWSSPAGGMNDKPISYYLPDYLNDLNACHEMEKVLDEGQKERFVFWINHLHPFADIHYSERKRATRLEVFSLVHATAAQRAVAFLHTLGLWQETPTQPQ